MVWKSMFTLASLIVAPRKADGCKGGPTDPTASYLFAGLSVAFSVHWLERIGNHIIGNGCSKYAPINVGGTKMDTFPNSRVPPELTSVIKANCRATKGCFSKADGYTDRWIHSRMFLRD